MPVLPEGEHLPERDGHRVWWCERGPAEGVPVLVLHGGPGGRTRAAPFGWFEGLPARCIAFDQRGCGRSVPAGELRHNTLDGLLADIEHLRERLGLHDWAVAGGSWGALLALAYAGTHPQRVRGLFLRSSFLGTPAEVASFFAPFAGWLGAEGAKWLGAAEPADPLALLDAWAAGGGGHGVAPGRVCVAWDRFERMQSRAGGLRAAGAGARFEPPAADAAGAPGSVSSAPLPPGAAVQWHYLRHNCFVRAGALDTWLSVIDAALAQRPIALVHGLDDAVCDAAQTRRLARRWPQARVSWVAGAGHDMDGAALRDALCAAARDWVAQLATCAGDAGDAGP